MPSPSLTGNQAKSQPNKYLGPNAVLTQCVTRNRAPTTADYRQPETGKLYPFSTFWLVGSNPTTGAQGDLWYLAYIAANQGIWVQMGIQAYAFLAQITTTQSNVTGNGALYSIIWDTIVQDTTDGAYDAGTGIFTAATTGWYNLSCCVLCSGVVAGNTIGQFFFYVNGVNKIDGINGNFFNMADANGILGMSLNSVYHLNAGDTVKVVIQASGGGTENISISGTVGAGSDVSHFSCTKIS